MESIHGKLSPVSTPIGGVLTTPPLISAELTIKPYPVYDGDYVVIPKAYDSQVLATSQKVMVNDVEVLQVPYFETSNESGITVYIAREV